jgi:Rps23 Pro-64 3,4-dihydroxylase Tpa1-like proline 4-hydroxylase
MKEQLIQLIISRLSEEKSELKEKFNSSKTKVGVRYTFIDNLLPVDIAKSISEQFPDVESMRLMDSFREKKYTSKNFEQFHHIMKDITFAFQDPRVIEIVGEITGIKDQIPDQHLYAGGLSAMGFNHFLGPHIDNSHDGERKLYRTLNLLYYVTPDWELEFGGNLELWDKDVKINEVIFSKFNRLVLMETNPWSWHSVSKVQHQGIRRCVSNYYFSPTSPTGESYFNVTSFSARPEQSLLRVMAFADNKVRQLVRKIIPNGLGKKDIYQKNKV